jgi:hypothetical protein
MPLRSLENDQIFESLKDLILRVNEHADVEDYAVMLFRIKKSKLRVRRKTWIKCDREDKSKKSKNQKRRHISSRLIEFSFLLTAKLENENIDSWLLKMINKKDNHSSSLVEAHSALRRMIMTEKVVSDIFRQLTVQISTTNVIFSLRVLDMNANLDAESLNAKEIVNFMFKSRDIYNLKAKLRHEILRSLTSIQTLLRELKKDDWIYKFQKDDENHLTHLFFIKSCSRNLLKVNYKVLVMNCIYKTNRYKMSLLIISN